jgi:hypothetical protein
MQTLAQLAAVAPPPRVFKIGCLVTLALLLLLQCGIIWGADAWGAAHAGPSPQVPAGCHQTYYSVYPGTGTNGHVILYEFTCP